MRIIITMLTMSLGVFCEAAPLVNGQDLNGAGQFTFQSGSTITINSAGDFKAGSSTASASNTLSQGNLTFAWAVFIGSATNNTAVTIVSGYNVASVNHTGTGVYKVNFGRAANSVVSYGCVCSVEGDGPGQCSVENDNNSYVPQTTTSITINATGGAGGQANQKLVSLHCDGF